MNVTHVASHFVPTPASQQRRFSDTDVAPNCLAQSMPLQIKKTHRLYFFSLPFPSFLRPSLVRASAKKLCCRPRRQSFHLLLLLLRLRSVPRANAAQQCSSGTTGRFNVRIQQETLCSGSAAGVKSSHKGLSITVTPAATRENPKNVVTQRSKRAEYPDL